ncbi:MAG: imidazole glycerol phosphate synthase subunit HisF [Methanomicrobiales archaeon]|jgi:cyclase|nr:imidazole glycerol phosphate synthase subunit HisF [Methanomicrobiales archaeon]
MALTKRIIPCLDIKDGRVVKGTKFIDLRDAGDPVERAAVYNEQGADEVVFLDITASKEKRGALLSVIGRAADELFLPLTVGGGIHDTNDITELLRAGADKVSINTGGVKDPELYTKGADIFGNQCIVAAIDVRRRYDIDVEIKLEALSKERGVRSKETQIPIPEKPNPIRLPDGTACWYEVVIYGGSTPTGIDAVWWAKEAEARGAGEILLTSMETDGEKDGFDLAITKAVADSVHVPIIASGGVGTLEHFYDGFTKGNADACLAASVFHYGTYTVLDVKRYLHDRGINVRL